MKQITIFLSDDEWKELVDTVRHELGEPMSDEEIERKMQSEIDSYVRATYLHSLGVQREIVIAHAKFLKVFFGAKVRLVNPDGNDEIEIQQYNTSSKVTTKELLKEIKRH